MVFPSHNDVDNCEQVGSIQAEPGKCDPSAEFPLEIVSLAMARTGLDKQAGKEGGCEKDE